MSEASKTTDPDVIRRWAEARGGRPARVEDTGGAGDPGLLRIKFSDGADELEEISWDEFFEKFEESRLAFLYQDKTDSGETSRFFKLVDRD